MVEYPLSPSYLVEDAMYFIFKEHAMFGRTASTAPGAEPTVMLDNANWAKLLLGSPGLVASGGNGSFRRSDIDLTFTKARKSERRLDYPNFLSALSLVAAKKYPEDSPIDAFSKLCACHLFGVLHNQAAGNLSSTSVVACALLDVPVPPPTPSLSSGVVSSGGGGGGGGNSPLPLPSSFSSSSSSTTPQALELRSRALGTQAGERNKSGGIFDKLSSVDTFTGVYRKRFDEQGRHVGGGINSYNGDISGNIRDLKEMTRTDIRANKHQFEV